MPQVSVLMPVYDGARTIGGAISSVLSQDFTDIEILVCDDDSSDNTVDIVEKFRDNRVRLLKNDRNLGVSATRNRLIREAHGAWIALLDADDEFMPGKMSYCVREIERTGCDAVSHSLRYITQGGRLRGLLPAKIIFPSGFMVRTSLATAIGGFREDLVAGEDTDFFRKIRTQGSIHFIDEPLAAIRLRSDSLTDRYWFDKRAIAQWYRENPEGKLPEGKTALREWFRQKKLTERIRFVTAWFGQRCGRRAAAYFFYRNYVAALWYAGLSLCINPSYLTHRIRRALFG